MLSLGMLITAFYMKLLKNTEIQHGVFLFVISMMLFTPKSGRNWVLYSDDLEHYQLERQNAILGLKELAKYCSINAKNIIMHENDKLEIGKKRALQLATAFDVHPAIIMFPEYESKEIQKVA